MSKRLGSKIAELAPGRIAFHCPGCKTAHVIAVDGSRGWTWNGDGNAPTIAPSVLVRTGRQVDPSYQAEPDDPPERCHSFIRAGRIEFLGDSTHALAGQTVELPDWSTL